MKHSFRFAQAALSAWILIFALRPLYCSCADANTQAQLSVTLDDVQRAHEVVKQVAIHTPLLEESYLSQLCGGRVFLKLENLQHTGSFKVRGAFNKVSSLPETNRALGVIAASAGNHAQGVALAARRFNVPATIVMPETVPQTKLEATRAHGANVLLYGKVFDEALAKAQEIQQQTGAAFVHPFDDPLAIAGQGTIGLEILEDLPDPDIVLVPVGGGGLIAGMAVAIKGLHPATRIIGVEPENAPSMTAALKTGCPTAVPITPTLAEGTAVSKIGAHTLPIAQQLMDNLITVSESEIAEAIRVLLLKDKVLTEGAGALGAAALLSRKKVVLILSGGNIDLKELQQVLQEQESGSRSERK